MCHIVSFILPSCELNCNKIIHCHRHCTALHHEFYTTLYLGNCVIHEKIVFQHLECFYLDYTLIWLQASECESWSDCAPPSYIIMDLSTHRQKNCELCSQESVVNPHWKLTSAILQQQQLVPSLQQQVDKKAGKLSLEAARKIFGVDFTVKTFLHGVEEALRNPGLPPAEIFQEAAKP